MGVFVITIKNTQRSIKINTNHVHAIIKKILQKLEYPDFDIGIWFTTNKTIQRYNKNYRKVNKPTDILSFNYHQNISPGKHIVVKIPEDKNLGDLIISAEYVNKVARELHKTFVNHLDTILIHGICHLIGHTHDHSADYKKMDILEKELMRMSKT